MIKFLKTITPAFVLSLLFTIAGPVSAQNSITEREVTFTNGSIELSGTLILPAQKEKAPAVVFLHGSGPHQREGFRLYAEEFADLGVASLFYDKRGTGSSGGSWTTSSLDDLANDALAAIEYLKGQNEIDSERIGFWGISQAGWVSSIAAAKSQDIAFMILISGGGATPRESEYYSYQKMFEQAGLAEDDKSEAFKIIDTYFDYLETGEGRTELTARLEELEADADNPLHQLPQVVRVPSDENRTNWSWVAAYDPATDIEKMNFPVLLMFGELDTDHPTELAVKRWTTGLEKAGNDKTTIMVFPGAGHGIRLGAGHNMKASFADGYKEIQLGWLWENVVKP